ncbi:sodium-dependent transporter [Agarilytica rhodophyticola]|uniref:sodium-dependent transporter n=1 Tax=Agarilytica rhodophyticola TaxID=1737490 RepID=UPI000B345059|nr:sodium-dependent transporter [Agarilytica rhodophyticola]
MSTPRGQFSSRIGFVMAATGSAVGLGNIWGFPTQTASNGGAAFVLVYLVLAFLLAYPALMAELVIGRHSRSNVVSALGDISKNNGVRKIGVGVGFCGVIVASLILSFYTIVAGWMLAYLTESATTIVGFSSASEWLTTQGETRNLIFGGIFAVLTMSIIGGGVEGGIEKWSSRLMPILIALLLALIVYVMTQKGATEGLKQYLLPDLGQISDPKLIISALGQAFFSLSLGVGTMLVYGSYLSKDESLPRLGAIVTVVDIGIAFTAGLLIIPAIYVAQHNGVQIYSEQGNLIAGPDLIFQVLPSLFSSMGAIGPAVSLAFFALMSIAAVTSSISMLEVPVSLAVEKTQASRTKATAIIGTIILAISTIIIFNFEALFGLVIKVTTEFSQPLLGIALCLFAGWVLRRDYLLAELKNGHPNIENTLFWKIWPAYVRIFCPALILLTFYHSVVA